MSRLAEWAADYGAFKLYQQSLGRKWFRFELWIKFEYIMGILSYHGRSNTIFLQEDILDSPCLPTLEERDVHVLPLNRLQVASKIKAYFGTIHGICRQQTANSKFAGSKLLTANIYIIFCIFFKIFQFWLVFSPK